MDSKARGGSATGAGDGAPTVSVVMRARNDGAVIGRTLEALAGQRGVTWELVALDNASTDGTREALVAHGARVIDVPEGGYNPGRVLNRGVAEARGGVIVMLNSDTVPLGQRWLAELTAPVRERQADAVYGRQVPRLDATTLVRLDYAQAFGAEAPRWQPFFSMAASAFRRQVLLERPFTERVQYSEDLEWARDALLRGLRLRYVPEAAAEHSHNYTLRETWRRFFEEGRADAFIFPADERPVRVGRSVVGVVRDVARDLPACVLSRDGASLVRSPLVRAAQRVGYLAGRLRGPREM